MSEMASDADEEGYPKLGSAIPRVPGISLRLRPRFRHQILQDGEYGETTRQQVIVLRRSKRSMGTRDANLTFSEETIRSWVSLRWTRRSLRHPIPRFIYKRPRYPEENNYFTTRFPKAREEKKVFRVPPEEPQKQSDEYQHGEKIIYISIWKECIYADNIFESTGKDITAVRKICQNESYSLGNTRRFFASYIPCFYIKIMAFLMLFVQCFLCKLTFPLAMYYRSHKHIKIHRSCEERGVRPVFTGSACHGPVIYGIRKLCCPYCRAQRQSDASMKLLEIMNKERSTWV